MKPISALTPDEAKELLFYTSDNGTTIPISKIISITPDTLIVGTETYSISANVYDILQTKLTTYEGVKLMYAQEDLAKQTSKITKEELASQFSEYFDHMDEVIAHVNTQATKVISHLQEATNTVSKAAKNTLSNIDSINNIIKPFKQFAADTNLNDLKTSVKTHVEQLAPIKDELGEVINHLRHLFSGKNVG